MKFKAFVLMLVVLTLLAGASISLAQDESEVTIWFHSSGASEVYQQQIADFNASQDEYVARFIEVPTGQGSSYNDAVQAAAVAGDLPCLLDLDGPNIYNYAWSGFLEPLESYIPEDYMSDFLPTIVSQGTFADQLYAIGASDSNIAIAITQQAIDEINAVLEESGEALVRIPEGVDDPWTLEEFNSYLAAAMETETYQYAIDTRMNFGIGEWYTYGFSPIVQSFGGDLIDRTDYMSAEGVLNGPEAVAAMTWLQDLYANGWSSLTPPDSNEFTNQNAAMGWFVNWMYTQYNEAFGDDLLILPMVDFGEGAVSGMGSWAWAMSSQCENKEGAWALLEYLLEPEQMDSWTGTFGSLPARISVAEGQEAWAADGSMNILIQQLSEGVAVPRPITPAYPTITDAFSTAMDNIIKGADVQTELDTAVDKIDAVIDENDGYPTVSDG